MPALCRSPLWERGLKCFSKQQSPRMRMSLPLWERGLKLYKTETILTKNIVAPPVGAWIEISSFLFSQPTAFRRSPCESVD